MIDQQTPFYPVADIILRNDFYLTLKVKKKNARRILLSFGRIRITFQNFDAVLFHLSTTDCFTIPSNISLVYYVDVMMIESSEQEVSRYQIHACQ